MSSNIPKKIKSFPNSPGVYIFRDKNRKIIYVGKATSLKDRVGSYFLTDANLRMVCESTNIRINRRPIEIMISEVKDIEIKKTETVLEAYILEQELIKKFQPKYNVDGKDDKSFSYVIFTKEDFPRILIFRGREQKFLFPTKKTYGPYTSKKQIEIALKILRKIFPYHNKKENSEKGCLDFQIGLCPGPYAGAISKSDYQKNIRGIKMILEGKKKSLLAKLKKEMAKYSKKEEFEKAGEIRNKIFALQHIRDIALISSRDEKFQITKSKLQIKSKSQNPKIQNMRIEGYDISNISGKFNVGSMVVFDNSYGEIGPNKSQYRKFRIKTIDGTNDVGAMREVLMRRFENNWPLPNLILLDGGAGHLNMARRILKNYKLEIPLLAVAKGPTRKKLDLRTFGNVPKLDQNIIEQIRNEAHRFAIGYHRKLRGKEFLGGVDN
ncbi:MAG: GIY-YIG nuclease family protein [bacterium]|nr:GIY-YIG nuclease family protein [bacterium]